MYLIRITISSDTHVLANLSVGSKTRFLLPENPSPTAIEKACCGLEQSVSHSLAVVPSGLTSIFFLALFLGTPCKKRWDSVNEIW